jgi:endonuclease V-like protein UPF0215 family
VAQAWYGLPEVSDEGGMGRMAQPLSSPLLKLMRDIGRFDCFIAAGGEMTRQRRNVLKSDEEIARLVHMVREGVSINATAQAMGISVTQARRIVKENITT